jgi:RecA/RadA recombinase
LYLARFIPPSVDLPNSTVARLKSAAQSHLIAPSTTALQLLRSTNSDSTARTDRLRTCLPELDTVLGGGYPARGLIEIAGPPHSFRTLLLFHATLAHLLQSPTATCCWIDTKGTFTQDVTRTVEIIKTLAADLRREGTAFKTATGEDQTNDQIVGATLERLLISVRVEREATLETIATSVQSSTASRRLGLIVIDSIDSILESAPSPQSRAQSKLTHCEAFSSRSLRQRADRRIVLPLLPPQIRPTKSTSSVV